MANIEPWKNFKGQLKKAMDFYAQHGYSVLDRNELKAIAKPIIREAKRRMRELERTGLTDSPAYRWVISEDATFSAKGTDRNTILHNLTTATEFLKRKTSTVEGTKEYIDSTINRFSGVATSREQRERIWDVYNRLEKLHPGYFMRDTYGSSELSQDIYDITSVLQDSKWDVDEAIDIIQKAEHDPFTAYDTYKAAMRWSGVLQDND